MPQAMDRRRQIRLPRAMDAYLEQRADELGVTVSDLIRRAVAECFILPTAGMIRTARGSELPGEAREVAEARL